MELERNNIVDIVHFVLVFPKWIKYEENESMFSHVSMEEQKVILGRVKRKESHALICGLRNFF